jgi:DNA-binding protein YbaB
MKKEMNRLEALLKEKLMIATKYIQAKEFIGQEQGVEVYTLGTTEIISVHIKDYMLENKDNLQDCLVTAINSCLIQISNAHKDLLDNAMSQAIAETRGEG